MECNKDEAIRAKEIAEKMMENNDFEGARKFAKKAQNLYPELENITQLLTVCDVHCSSQKRVLGSEKDWYEILQVERFADELIVKKQYRRLALFLHPDKNRFPGAEAAFKLICDANNVLSDPGKKSLYDCKIRVSVRSTPVNPPTHHITKNSHFNNKYRDQKNASNGFSSLNSHQAAGSSSSVKQECFWTCCSFCKVKYQYERKFVNRALRCQQCLKPFWAHEISARGLPLESKGGQPVAHPMSSKAGSSQHAGFQEKWIPDQADFKMGVKNDKGVSASYASQENAGRKTGQQEPQNQAGSGSGGFQTECAAKSSKDSKIKETDFCDVNLSQGEKEAGKAHGDAITRETGDPKDKGRKRGRKPRIESSESFDTSIEHDMEDVFTGESFGGPTTEMDSVPPAIHLVQRSTRKRQHVIYNEKLNDFVFPRKGAQAREIPDDSRKEMKDAEDSQGNASNGFSSLNPHHAAGSSFSVWQARFWTCCSYCKVKYQYERKFVNKFLRCQQCFKPFWAHEISARGVPLGSKGEQPVAHPMSSKAGSSQPVGFQEKEIPNQDNFKMGVKNDKGVSASHASQENAHRKTVQQEPQNQTGSGSGGFQTECAAKSRRDSKVKETDFGDVKLSHGEKEAGTAHVDAITRETEDLKNKGRKRGRKQVIESSESFDTLSEYDMEDVVSRENFGHAATEMDSESPGVHFIQRSTRKRQHVIYNENGSDYTFPRKGAQARKLPDGSGKEYKDALNAEDSVHGNQNSFPSDADNSMSDRKQIRTVHPEGSLQCKVRRETCARPCTDADKVEIKSDSDTDSHSSDNSDADLCVCPDAEFSDFDKYRDDNRFAINQIWACYDTLDGMPRFYAKVRKISKSPFELSFTWFEADPKDEAHKKWVKRGLPIGCGSFKLGKTEKTTRRLSFSHQMYCAEGQKRGSFIIYPRKGEIWAIFKDWDMNWSSNPENRVFKYEIVEVLSDFVAGAGIKVGYLDKIIGFLSLFQRISPSKTDSILIGPSQLYKFSHRVPCCQMTGTERAGVPKDSFELDPASLPLNPDELYYPSKGKMECGNLDLGVNSSPADLAKKNRKSVVPEGTSGPKEYVDLEGMDVKVSKLRRSPRGMNLNGQKGN